MSYQSAVVIRALDALTEYESWTIKQKDLFREIYQTMGHELMRGAGTHTYAKLGYASPCMQCSSASIESASGGKVQVFMRAENNWHTPLIKKFGKVFPEWKNRGDLIGIAPCGECQEPHLIMAD